MHMCTHTTMHVHEGETEKKLWKKTNYTNNFETILGGIYF